MGVDLQSADHVAYATFVLGALRSHIILVGRTKTSVGEVVLQFCGPEGGIDWEVNLFLFLLHAKRK